MVMVNLFGVPPAEDKVVDPGLPGDVPRPPPPPPPGWVLISAREGMRRTGTDQRYRRCLIQTFGRDGQRREDISLLATRCRVRINKSGIPAAYRNSEYGVWVDDMANFMEQCIIGLRYNSSSVSIDINFSFRSMSGSTLAQCGPGPDGGWNPLDYLSSLRLDVWNGVATVNNATMVFNTNYWQVNPTETYYRNWKRMFFQVACHEAFHAYGLGSLWNGPFRIVTPPLMAWNVQLIPAVTLAGLFPYNVIGSGNPSNPRYTASNARNAWRETMEGQSGASGIPIENYGMSSTTLMGDAGGTALAHWRTTGGYGAYRDLRGRTMDYELLGGWTNNTQEMQTWVGRFTIASLRDIGWSVSYTPLELELYQYKSVT